MFELDPAVEHLRRVIMKHPQVRPVVEGPVVAMLE